MNKSALKRFATTMRRELISVVQTKVDFLLSDAYKENLALYATNKKHIAQIEKRYSKDGEDFIEEVAYTWFNRLVALRFMDVNSITLAQTLSTTEEQPIPQIFVDAKAGNIEDDLNLNRELFFDLIDKKVAGVKDSDNQAYKMLFISVCNYYGKLMPTMFEEISDYTELLLPEDMLSPNSLRAEVVEAMSEEDCQDIEVIGWLYQFYISEKKDDVFAKLKKNQKITPANIPAATQLFTPHWIVKYMVENSLGKLWMLNNPTSTLKESMKYYIENEEETTTFIKVEKPEEITFLDPCCGSGHTLTYAFDLLTAIYEEEGYNKSEIPSLILENNLFGCDIDKRASVLANFALTMKARQYHKRFFKKDVKPNIVELEDYASDEFAGIKNFGSLLVPHSSASFDDGIFGQSTREYEIQKKILLSEFHCVVTNPPYMGGKGMNKELSDFVKKRYPDSKSDLMNIFLERCLELTKKDGFMSMIILPSWLFLSSSEKLRKKLLKDTTISSLLHMGRGIFGIDWGSTAFTIQKSKSNGQYGSYFRLHQRNFQHIYYEDIGLIFLNALSNHQYKYNFESYRDEEADISKVTTTSDKNGLQIYYTKLQEDFSKIPGSPIGYWVSENVKNIFDKNDKISDIAEAIQGMITGNNEILLRLWFEVSNKKVGLNFRNVTDIDLDNNYWIPYNKGGENRKWYGNHEYLVNWQNNGNDLTRNRSKNKHLWLQEGVNWGYISSTFFSAKYFDYGYFFDVSSSSAFPNKKDIQYITAFLNTKLSSLFLKIIAPTINFQVEDIEALPIIFPKSNLIKKEVEQLSLQNIDISKEDWNSRETSWDFTKNELIKPFFGDATIQ